MPVAALAAGWCGTGRMCRGSTLRAAVEASDDARYKPGDKVVLTGWRVGEVHWGGYAQKARVKADWLVPLPAGLTTRQAMAVGTAGSDRDAGGAWRWRITG